MSYDNVQDVTEFTADGYFYQYKSGKKKEFKLLEEVNGGYKEIDYGNMSYHQTIQGDSILIRIVGEKNKKIYAKHLCFVNGNHLTMVLYKQGKGINNHIQMTNSFYRKDTKKEETEKYRTLSLIIPNNIPKDNVIYVAYGQPNGENPTISVEGDVILEIPKSGLLKTTFVEDVRMSSMGTFKAFYRNIDSKIINEIKVVQFNEVNSFLNNLRNGIGTNYIDSTMLFVERFNPGRERVVNKIFNSNIEGNVQTFTLSTPRERYSL